jgi:hypothetical protein
MVGPFRDSTPGAEARRRDLLVRRRDDLAVTPHAIRGVYVGRAARAAAALVLAAGGALVIGASVAPELEQALLRLGPPSWTAVMLTFLLGSWLAAAIAYLLARCIAEHRYGLAMSRCVLPTDDLDTDIERLSHVRPRDEARRMAHRLEPVAVALPVLAAAAVGPATAVAAFDAAAHMRYPHTAAVEDQLVAYADAMCLIAAAGAALAAALLATRGRRREQISFAFGALATAAGGIAITLGKTTLFVATGAALLGWTAVAFGWHARRERTRIDASELALDGLRLRERLGAAARSARAGLAATARAARAALRRPPSARSALLCAGLAASLVAWVAVSGDEAAPLPAPRPAVHVRAAPRPAPAPLPKATRTAAPAHADYGDSPIIELSFDGRKPETLRWQSGHLEPREYRAYSEDFEDFDDEEPSLDYAWTVRARITLLSIDGIAIDDISQEASFAFRVTPNADLWRGQELSVLEPVADFAGRWTEPGPIGFELSPMGTWPRGRHTVRLHYEPMIWLEAAGGRGNKPGR